jgi:hypothetical protein
MSSLWRYISKSSGYGMKANWGFCGCRCFDATSYAINLAHDVNFGTFELDADNFPPNWT